MLFEFKVLIPEQIIHKYILFLWIIFSFSCQCPLKHKSLNFDKVKFICFFSTIALLFVSYIYMKVLLNARSQRFIPRFYFKNVIVLALPFQCLLHCELIFIYGVKWGFNFILLNVGILFSHYHLLKRLFFPH